MNSRDTVQAKLADSRKDLLDLGLRNSLLNYRTNGARSVEIVDEKPAQIFRLLVREKKALAFLGDPLQDKVEKNAQPALFDFDPPASSPSINKLVPEISEPVNLKRYTDLKLQTRLSTDALQKRLLKTLYEARSSIEDQGINILYLAAGMLEWYEAESSTLLRKAPLLLIPVELVRSDVRERFQVRFTEEDLGHNLSLEAKLKSDFDITLPHLAQLEEFDVELYFSQVSQAIANQHRWRVDPAAIFLGFFSFGKFILYKDLEPGSWSATDNPADHPIISGLFLGDFSDPLIEVNEHSNLDRQPIVSKLQLVLDADSSQMLALVDATNGRNLVIHGPPGTGKSQTITNLIAQCLQDGKTVLFVAEKMAALEVVKRRLDDVGLGSACLELHSHKANKKTVLAELALSLNPSLLPGNQVEQEGELYVQSRERLNSYTEAVNTPIKQSGLTPYQALGHLLQLQRQYADVTLPKIDFKGYHDCSQTEYFRLKALVDELAAVLKTVGAPLRHPFWGSGCLTTGLSGRETLEAALSEALTAIQRLQIALQSVVSPLSLPVPTRVWNFGMADFILNVPSLYGLNLQAVEWLDRSEELNKLLAIGTSLSEANLHYSAILTPEAWNQPDLLELRQILASYDKKWWRKWSRKYREASATLAALCINPPPEALATKLEYIDALLLSQQLQTVWQQQQLLGNFLYQDHWKGLASNWPLLKAMANWSQQLHEAIKAGNAPPTLATFLASQPDLSWYKQVLRGLQSAGASYLSSIQRLIILLQLDEVLRFGAAGPLIKQTFSAQIQTLQKWQQHSYNLQEFASFNEVSLRCKQAGLDSFISAVEDWPGAGLLLGATFDKNWYSNLLNLAFNERNLLESFNRETHEQVIANFRRLDKQALNFNRASIVNMYNARVQTLQNTTHNHKDNKVLSQELRLLNREIEKKTRHLPLRKLLKSAGSVIQTIKPVFMMSPLSVAAYLSPGAMQFDMVIFDEASQVRPADAFGAILRGRQLVVAGDDKQLPPSSFFEKLTQTEGSPSEDDEDDEDDALYVSNSGDFESILKLFRAASHPRMLRWHYRSRHESLIAVSNSEFYDNQLIIFPSPDAERKDSGLVYRYLSHTIYDRSKSRTNLQEASEVAKAVMEHAKLRPDLTLGVATFSMAQRQAVAEQLELLRRQDPTCETFFNSHPNEPFFVKNLENVQGDERDCIFISVGYGHDADGKVTMNFGPLTGRGGERRLNVLITRARRRCEVFTNLTADDLDLNRTASSGVRALKTFLQYAQTGKIMTPAAPSGRSADSPFEEEVLRALTGRGYEVVPQVGQAGFFIDLAIVDPDKPGRYVLGIECDGATYHSALSARDRDRLRQQLLENLGWRIHRIWSTDWFRNQNREIERTIKVIELARSSFQPPVEPAKLSALHPQS